MDFLFDLNSSSFSKIFHHAYSYIPVVNWLSDGFDWIGREFSNFRYCRDCSCQTCMPLSFIKNCIASGIYSPRALILFVSLLSCSIQTIDSFFPYEALSFLPYPFFPFDEFPFLSVQCMAQLWLSGPLFSHLYLMYCLLPISTLYALILSAS